MAERTAPSRPAAPPPRFGTGPDDPLRRNAESSSSVEFHLRMSISLSIPSLLISMAVAFGVESGFGDGGADAAGVAPGTPSEDRVDVRFSRIDGATDVPAGSIMVLLLPATRPPAERPAEGPWWDRPHPFGVLDLQVPTDGIAYSLSGRPAENTEEPPPNAGLEGIFDSGEMVRDEADSEGTEASPGARWYPQTPDSLTGSFRVQAVFRPWTDPVAGGGSEWRSRIAEVDLRPDRTDRIDLVLEPVPSRGAVADRVVGAGPPPAWIEFEMPSPMLASAGVASPEHRAWVVFPSGYHDLQAERRVWPTIYLMPHAGDGRAEAEAIRDAIAVEGTRTAMPQAIWVVLDAGSPWGHHGFADSETHGPRETALLEEFIPELERRHRLVPDPDARLLVGHGAGGWSAIRLQLSHPDRFGGAFVTSPELVDLSRLGWLDAYGTEAFIDPEGRSRPAYREPVGDRDAAVRTVLAQEWAMAEIASPTGRSGNRWHRWAALASPPTAPGERPPPLFDSEGRIDRELAETRWLPLDLAAELVREPRRLIPIWVGRIHVWVGSLDEFGHERALLSLQTLLAELSADLGLPRPNRSVVRLVPGATFDTVVPNTRIDAYRAMIRHLEAAGFAE